MKVFVYGTLKSGYGANSLLGEGRTLLGETTIAGEIYHLGGFPGVRLGGESKVHGEVWEVPESSLPRLDRYEGEGSLYIRHEITTEFGPAWVYEYNDTPPVERRIASGRWPE